MVRSSSTTIGLAPATRRLIDPATHRLPVPTIALDVGNASLAPLNKVFKTTHGPTPTEYRKRHGIP